eukprot:CAMPEP_0180420582 /NCGR_PEP_ID=MMETSP1036_2-20121128/2706_1 /TAXON_ID=632150 /ORGANISM="Azadinium spinosum, Strain 3D9" /LENGTH=84 /DNA_ID=CAMNT_0022425813 /DNA_START=15 /DNA_END=269 /DNA_ORIENTATION=+
MVPEEIAPRDSGVPSSVTKTKENKVIQMSNVKLKHQMMSHVNRSLPTGESKQQSLCVTMSSSMPFALMRFADEVLLTMPAFTES